MGTGHIIAVKVRLQYSLRCENNFGELVVQDINDVCITYFRRQQSKNHSPPPEPDELVEQVVGYWAR